MSDDQNNEKQRRRSRNMSLIKSKNTSIELTLRRELFRQGLRYRLHDKTVYGKPDIVFKKQKVAIFCDSEFWHGKKYLEGERFKSNADFWETKIKKNIERDKEVNECLKSEGWTVLRFWGNDIDKNIESLLKTVFLVLKK